MINAVGSVRPELNACGGRCKSRLPWLKQELLTSVKWCLVNKEQQDPTPLLANPALLPLATLARSDSPNSLLEQVAAQVDMIEENDERQNISACTQILAGLRFDKNLIQRLFREEIMQESVIYQDILQKGEQKGKKQEALALILRQLPRRIGSVTPQLQEQIRSLSVPQLEDLGEALLDFSSETDLINWLATQHL